MASELETKDRHPILAILREDEEGDQSWGGAGGRCAWSRCRTGQESARFRELEAIISRGRKTYIEVGEALDEIRAKHLYRYTHRTFEAYCRERWGFSKPWAYRQIKAARYATMVPMGTKPPENERQARAARCLAPRRPSVRLMDFMAGRLGEFEHHQIAGVIAETRDARNTLQGVRDVPHELLRLYSVAIGFLEAWLAGEQAALVAAKQKLTGEDIIAVEEHTRRRRAMLTAMGERETEEDLLESAK